MVATVLTNGPFRPSGRRSCHHPRPGARERRDGEPDYSDSRVVLTDKVVKNSRKKYYVNIKITNMKVRPSKSDIAAVEKLYMQYQANPDYRLIYVVFGFSFSNITVSLDRGAVHVFSPQFLPIYVNPRNDKLQAHYRSARQVRSRSEFLNLLQKESRSIVLT